MTTIRSILFIYAFLFSLTVNAGDTASKLSDLFSFQDASPADEILDPEIAFRVSADVYSTTQLTLNWEIEPGYYLYKNKFSLSSDETGVTLGDTVFPTGKLKKDPAFGQVEVYYGQNEALIPFQLLAPGQTEFNLNVGYQGCKEDSVCYPPIKKTLAITLPAAFASTSNNSAATQAPLLSEQDTITQTLKDKNLFINILSFFGFGLLLALTPCVFPMIPILSGIIVGEGERITRTRGLTLSLSYVFAMALTYAVLGVIAGLFNLNLQAASQNVWVLSLFSGVFVLLALSMFGFYELQLPSSWQSKLSSSQDQAGRGTLKGAASWVCCLPSSLALVSHHRWPVPCFISVRPVMPYWVAWPCLPWDLALGCRCWSLVRPQVSYYRVPESGWKPLKVFSALSCWVLRSGFWNGFCRNHLS